MEKQLLPSHRKSIIHAINTGEIPKSNDKQQNKSSHMEDNIINTNSEPVELSVDRRSKLLVVKQGNYQIRLTKDQVTALNKLRNGEMPNDAYITSTMPRTRFKLQSNGTISMRNNDGVEQNLIVLKKTRRYDDLERITAFMEANRPHIAWSRDFKKRY